MNVLIKDFIKSLIVFFLGVTVYIPYRLSDHHLVCASFIIWGIAIGFFARSVILWIKKE